MLTIRAEIKRNELRSDGTYNVKIRFTQDRKVKRVSTSIFVTPQDLTKSFTFKEGTVIKRQIDELVYSYREQCGKLQVEINHYTLDNIVAFLNGEKEKTKTIDFIQFSKEWIENTTIKGAKNYKTAINVLISFVGKESLDINKINSSFLNEFTEYLNKRRSSKISILQREKKCIPSNRASSLYLGSIRHLFNEAKKKYNDYDRNILLISNSPFENFKVPKQEATRKRALSAELIKKIWELPYIYNVNGREKNCPYNLAKDCFILSFCLIGMNSVDLYNCTELQDNAITYYRTKTTDRRLDNAKMVVIIPQIIIPIIKKYQDYTKKRIFNFYHNYSTADNFNKAINHGLKEIGRLLEMDDLEYYAARHSWATIAVNKAGIDKYTVHAALNHIDETMRITDIYIERDFKIENDANTRVVKYVFEEK